MNLDNEIVNDLYYKINEEYQNEIDENENTFVVNVILELKPIKK